jgi:hypothetical protein
MLREDKDRAGASPRRTGGCARRLVIKAAAHYFEPLANAGGKGDLNGLSTGTAIVMRKPIKANVAKGKSAKGNVANGKDNLVKNDHSVVDRNGPEHVPRFVMRGWESTQGIEFKETAQGSSVYKATTYYQACTYVHTHVHVNCVPCAVAPLPCTVAPLLLLFLPRMF